MTGVGRVTSVLLLAFLAFAAFWSTTEAQAATTAPLSGCDVCASTSDCSKAYLNAPGQYCGPWLDTASQKHSCCCPRDSTCDRGTYSCNCKKLTTSKPTPTPTPKAKSESSKKWIFIVAGVIVLLIIIGVAYYFWSRSNSDRRSSISSDKEVVYVEQHQPAPVYVEQPPPQLVYQQGGYAQQGYAPGAYPAQQTVHHYHSNSPRGGGMGTGAGIAVGAAAGLVGGMLIGNALADGGDNDNQSNNYGGGGGGDDYGGDTFAGDF